jgi:hypothetical protein
MSISGILGSSFLAGNTSTTVQNKFQQIKQDFRQLGQDLQSGNLTQAQSDFTALQQLLPGQQQSAQRPRRAPQPARQAPQSPPIRFRRRFHSWDKTCNPEILPQPSRTSRPFSRTFSSSKELREQARLMSTITMAGARKRPASRVKSRRCSQVWARRFSLATSRLHSRPTARCNRTSCSSAAAPLLLVPALPAPPRRETPP